MKKTFFIAGIILSFLIATSVVYACQPCRSTLNFEETVEKSDLIIIGQRTDFSPNEQDSYETLPDNINVKIIKILKGDTNQNQITVNSWDGMCQYGIVVDDKKYVMLLQKRDPIYVDWGPVDYDDVVDYDPVGYNTVDYDAVDCAADTFLVDNDLVDFYGDKISIDEFTDKLGSQISKPIIDDKSDPQSSLPYFIILVILILIILFFIIIKIKKK